MIIAGFAGVGKTTFCNQHKNAIDFVVMPFKYENYDAISKQHPGENIKAHPDLVLKTDWRYDYYDALIKTQEKYPDEIIVIPTDLEIMDWLERDNIEYTLVYPSYWAQEEYRKRFIDRGNTEEFIDAFINDWDYWIKSLSTRCEPQIIELKAHQHLSDVIEVPNGKRIIKNKENYINKIKQQIFNFSCKDVSLTDANFIAVHKQSGKRIEFNIFRHLDIDDYEIYIDKKHYWDEDEVEDIYLDNLKDNDYQFRLKRPDENEVGLIKPIQILFINIKSDYKFEVGFSNQKVLEFDFKNYFLARGITDDFNIEKYYIDGNTIRWHNSKFRISIHQLKAYMKNN